MRTGDRAAPRGGGDVFSAQTSRLQLGDRCRAKATTEKKAKTVRAREERVQLQGVRRRGDVRTQLTEVRLQGVRRFVDMPTQTTEERLQGVRRFAGETPSYSYGPT